MDFEYVHIMFLMLVICSVYEVRCGKDWFNEKNPNFWNNKAKSILDNVLNQRVNKNVAKNLILFLGDGMGITTVTAGRIRKGQMMGLNGEEYETNMEKLPNLGLSKTYNIDSQTPDSAGTGTAYLCGVKTRSGIIGLNGYARRNDCSSTHANKLDSILKWAHKSGRSTGIVTTTRVTHATPAASYAHVPHRDWESFDGSRFTNKTFSEGCRDIASQLIDQNSFINVVLGGGRMMFLPNTVSDNLETSRKGTRVDNRNLIQEWLDKMKLQESNKKYKYIWSADDFRNTDFKDYDHILGLVGYDHLKYEADRDNSKEPSITEMTLKAIELLSQNENGFFLLVEGGRIDHGHHENKARKAIDDFVAFDDAIGEALKVLNLEETMVVVTADHSHMFSIGGNPMRGNEIYGIVGTSDYYLTSTNLTFTSLLYGNGPGGLKKIRRYNLTNAETEHPNYTQEAVVPKKMATHGAEDVAIYSIGPMSFLFSHTVEQNFITHAMAYSACIGPYANDACKVNRGIIDVVNNHQSRESTASSSSSKSTFNTPKRMSNETAVPNSSNETRFLFPNTINFLIYLAIQYLAIAYL